MQNATGPIVLLILVGIGFALFWARHLAYRQRPTAADDVMKLIMSIAAWVCVLVGVTGVLLHGLYVLAPLGLVVFFGVLLMLITRYRALERRALLRCLAVSAMKGVPLNEAARAFANERSDELGLRAVRLAEVLEAGMSFPQALIYSGTRLPIDALLAVRVGFETGTLSESLRRVARFDSDLDSLIRSVFEKAMYLIWIWIALIILLAFVFLRIIPVFSQMFREFGIPLPGMTQLLVTTSETAAPYLVLTIPLVLVLLLAALGGSLYYIDLLPYGAPGVQWIRRRLDGVLVMRVLSLAVSCGWPMNRTIWLLARVYPTGPIRKRLARAGRLVDDGQDWCGSLRQVGLLRQADWAVLKSATRVGNLEWALEEMADGSLRRSVYRMRLLISFIFPTTLFLCGLFVGYVAIALFVPLISLVQGLT